MSTEADQEVSEDMSLPARLLLGGTTLLIGALMVRIASPEEGGGLNSETQHPYGA